MTAFPPASTSSKHISLALFAVQMDPKDYALYTRPGVKKFASAELRRVDGAVHLCNQVPINLQPALAQHRARRASHRSAGFPPLSWRERQKHASLPNNEGHPSKAPL